MHIRFDGYEIGCTHDSDVFISDYEIGETEIESNDTDRLGFDGVMPGTDYLRDAQWVFALTVHNQEDTKGVLDRMAALERAWKAWANRSDGSVPLEYSTGHDGVWHKIYGRPRQYLPPRPDAQTAKGRSTAQITFQQQDPLHYSSELGTTTISVAPGASGGVEVPMVLPLEFVTTGGTRDHWVHNTGDNHAPLTSQFNGPATNPEVRLQGGWRFRINGTLEWDEYLIVDPMARTANIHSTTRPGQQTAYHLLGGSRFSDLYIPPGQSVLEFTAVDDTYQASVTVSWPHTSISMQ